MYLQYTSNVDDPIHHPQVDRFNGILSYTWHFRHSPSEEVRLECS